MLDPIKTKKKHPTRRTSLPSEVDAAQIRAKVKLALYGVGFVIVLASLTTAYLGLRSWATGPSRELEYKRSLNPVSTTRYLGLATGRKYTVYDNETLVFLWPDGGTCFMHDGGGFNVKYLDRQDEVHITSKGGPVTFEAIIVQPNGSWGGKTC